MTHQTIQLSLTLDLEPDLDNEALEQLTRQLRQELLELDLKGRRVDDRWSAADQRQSR